MIKQALLEGFKKSTSGKNQSYADRIIKNDLISDITYNADDEKIEIVSSVISEDLFNQYGCKLDINKNSKEVEFSECTCEDFEKRKSRNKNYVCKHITASFYKLLQEIECNPEIKNELGLIESKEELVRATESSLLDFLLGKEEDREYLKFEVILKKISWTGKIAAEFKIGKMGTKSNKMYALKDIDGFLVALYNRIPINYGKDFTFDIRKQKLSASDKKLIKFIELLKDIDLSGTTFKKVEQRFVNGKQIIIPKALLRQFIDIVSNHRIYLGSGFYSRIIETEIIKDEIPLPLNLREVANMLKLEAPRGIPEPLADTEDVYLYDTCIYLPPEEQIERLKPYLEAFNHGNAIFFTKSEEERVLNELVPAMQKVTNDLALSEGISNKIVVAPVSFKFYFDKDSEITLKLVVCYDKYEFNYFETFKEKIIYRDTIKEGKVIEKLRALGFEIVNKRFVFFKSEEYIFKFFKEDVLELQEYGEVFYSDDFTAIKNISQGSFKADVKHGKYDYFDFKFKIDDVPKEEVINILNAFRDNKKYYRLKSGEFLDLEEIELKKFLKLIDSLEQNSTINGDTIEIHKSKGMYLEDYLEEEDIRYVKGRRGLKSLRNSLKNLKRKEFVVPDNINVNLRNYQKEGYTWLKTLDFLGFGGILGDEMGLGKTLQTITFLASNEGKKSLIVAPTSLVYNWNSEFKKFAPSLKIGVLNGMPKERKNIIKSFNKYDVLITTYNLVKRDLELYENIEFDYCILDEAQNIKNGHSQNAKVCKAIKAKRKFALTGTPLENSLMELWSIFDFIMPGYLYNEKKFTTRYHRRLAEDEVIIKELTRLIKPFILRRYKKDVIKELPDKIEKKLVVPMDDKQIEVYGTYASYVKDVIEKKVKDDEFKNSKIEILAFITKLRQICLDPSVVMDNYNGGSGKIDALIELVTQSIEEGHKILIFSQFTSVLKNIAARFKFEDIDFYYLDGSTPSKARGGLVESFNNDNTPVFLISLKAGGTGLNLTSADVVIHFDPWWNPAVEDQATDRAHRIGQKKVVEVIKMVSENSIEEKIIELQEEKKKLIDKIVGEEVELGENFNSLSEKEVLSFFEKN